MSDLISRQAAIEAVNIDNLHRGIVDALQNIILELPSADVVPVVRCKDCKYNNACFTQSFVESEGVLPFDRSTWFCADGERKDDETD